MQQLDLWPQYVVFVDDNFHMYDESERYLAGRFQTLEEAVTECAVRTLEDLAQLHDRPGMGAAELYDRYVSFGEDAWVQAPALTELPFSAWHFAKRAAPIVAQLARRRDSGASIRPESK